MTDETPEDGLSTAPSTNYDTFRECLSEIIIPQLEPVGATPEKRKRSTRASRKKDGKEQREKEERPGDIPMTNAAEDLGDFLEYLAQDTFYSLPTELQELSYAAVQNDPSLSATYSPPLPLSSIERLSRILPPSTLDSLGAYGLLPDPEELQRAFIEPLLTAYTAAVTAPPPAFDFGKRASACQICERDWIPLTYHHLIPRSTHPRVLKRGWHEEWELNSVAWLCRACHSMVHRLGSNEDLAKSYYTVDKLLDRDEVRKFASWVGGVRWKAR